jgi:hypothetical protein
MVSNLALEKLLKIARRGEEDAWMPKWNKERRGGGGVMGSPAAAFK